MVRDLDLICATGIFRLKKKGVGIYEAKANGVAVKIEKNSVSVKAGMSNFFFFFDGTLRKELHCIASKIDECCEDLIDNNESDCAYLKTSKGKLAYYAYNTHLKSTPVIFLHGGPGGDSNTKRARMLCLNHPIYLYDQMGCGRSGKIKNIKKWNHDSYVSELEEFVDVMKFKKVILIGASWGAGLAASYAIKTKCKKIKSMVLVSPFFSSKVWEEDQFNNLKTLDEKYQNMMFQCLQGKGNRKKYVKVMEEYNSHFLFSQKQYREIAVAAANEEPPEVFKAMVGENEFVTTGNMRDFDIVGDLGKISVPVLMMNGDSDEVRIETAKRFSKSIKNCKLKIVKNAGHALSFEQFFEYKKNIEKFV